MQLFLLQLLLILEPILSTIENIWLIRHCDKTINDNNPCCSNYGYDRANNWHEYFERYIDSSPYIYASNYNEEKTCIVNYYYKSNSDCQKSQRMFLTAQAIHDTFNHIKNDVNIDYCTGQYVDLVKSLDDISNKQVIIVWEHKEIVDIINYIGIKLDEWPKDAADEYNVVFMIDINKNQLYYDCYNWEDDDVKCSNVINDWLYKYESISSYYDKINTDENTTRNMLSKEQVDINSIYNFYIGLFFSSCIVIFGICILFFLILLCKKICKENYIHREINKKYKYVRIDETQPLMHVYSAIQNYV